MLEANNIITFARDQRSEVRYSGFKPSFSTRHALSPATRNPHRATRSLLFRIPHSDFPILYMPYALFPAPSIGRQCQSRKRRHYCIGYATKIKIR